jgi:Tol biopolymer transport system component
VVFVENIGLESTSYSLFDITTGESKQIKLPEFTNLSVSAVSEHGLVVLQTYDESSVRELFVAIEPSGKASVLSETDGHLRSVAISPDGDYIAAVLRQQTEPSYDKIFLYDVARSESKTLSDVSDGALIANISWTDNMSIIITENTISENGIRELSWLYTIRRE